MEDLQPLNNCEIFNQIRIEFTNFHNQEKKLNTFNYFSGNEHHIKELARRVNSVLLEHGLVEQQEHPEDEDRLVTKATPGCQHLDQLRGAMMYLILNSVHIKSEEQDSKLERWNPQCVHLLNQWPASLSQLVTVSLALECGMAQQFLEFLGCGPYWLTSQYFDCFNDTLSHVVSDRDEMLPLICGALSAVTKSICYHNSNVNLMPNALRLLQRHLLDSEERLRQIRARIARHRYLGEAMRGLLDVVLETIRAVDVKLELPDYFFVYALRLAPLQIKQETEEDVVDYQSRLRTFAGKLMDTVQRLLPQISVDTYMTWQDLPSGRMLFHLQAHICNQSKQLLQLSAKDAVLKAHSLRSQLVSIADGAQSLEQRLEMLTLGELLGFLDGELGDVNNEMLVLGLNQLLERPIAFGNDECIETMVKYVNLLGFSNASTILIHLLQVQHVKKLQMEQDSDEEDADYTETYDELISQVLLPIYKKCTNREKRDLLYKRDMLQEFRFHLDTCDARRISFFNTLRYSMPRFPMDTFLDLCFEQPQQTWLSFAQLAMVHKHFATLYRYVVRQCDCHAANYMEATMQHLMQDDRLLLRAATRSPTAFLLELYELPIYLIDSHNVSIKVDLSVKLQKVQNEYLSCLAAGLAKFTESRNYAALERLLKTLLQLEPSEVRHISSYRKKVKAMVKKKSKSKRQCCKIQKNRKTIALIRKLGLWRTEHWTLTSQLILSMDQLRGDLIDFDIARIQVLDFIMSYYVKNMPRFLSISANRQSELNQLLQTLQHKHLWKDDQLALFMAGEQPLQPKECVELLAQASGLEAIKLFSDAINQKIDQAVMTELAQAADLANSKAYSFLFKCYLQAFNNVLIKSTKTENYPCLIEHLLQVPKLQNKENLLLAVDTLKKLLNTTEDIDTEKILELATLKLQKSVDS